LRKHRVIIFQRCLLRSNDILILLRKTEKNKN
jgi:hypothetical protein